jgi:predicted transport protein
MIATMKERTGKTLEEWLETIRPVIPAQKNGRVKWMKETYGLGQNSVMVILAHLEGDGAELRGEAPDLVDGQYKGANAPLRPLYDALAAQILALGPDVVVRPCKGYVPFYRKKTFCYVQPLKGKLYAGLELPEGTEHPRLQPAAGLVTGPERMKFATEVTAVDDELLSLIKQAYERN